MTDWFISILSWIQSWLGSYGWSVIVFSLIIKLVLLPLDIKSRRSMRAMSALAPQMEKLKAKYANDQEKLNHKMQELYAKNKVNPLSGCLPMLIQLPILWIMFSAMRHMAAQMQLDMMYNWIAKFLCDSEGNLLALDTESVQAVIASLKDGSALATFGDTQSWLWIKSVFQPDSFGKVVFPTLSELNLTLSQYPNELEEAKMLLLTAYANDVNGLASAVDNAIATNVGGTSFYLFLNMFKISIPGNWGTYVNGYFILPILAGVSQWLATKLQPGTDPAANQNGTGKFMKWFFPIFSVWICISSTAAFAIYWVFVNAWSIISSIAINKILEMDDAKKNGPSSDTEKEALQP